MSKQWFDERLYEMKQERDRLAAENARLKELWYQDADPDETEFHLDYRAALAKVKESGK